MIKLAANMTQVYFQESSLKCFETLKVVQHIALANNNCILVTEGEI